jgi:hypothetical protein
MALFESIENRKTDRIQSARATLRVYVAPGRSRGSSKSCRKFIALCK